MGHENPEERAWRAILNIKKFVEAYYDDFQPQWFSLGVFHCIQWNKSSDFQIVNTNILPTLHTHCVPGTGPDFRDRVSR